jgi:hypothetical protein
MLTYEEAELNRQDRLNEVGEELGCPLCGRENQRRSRRRLAERARAHSG